MPVDAGALERIALTRLPELQGADGLFHPTPGREGNAVRSSAVALIGLAREEEAASAHGLSVGALRTGMLGSLSDPALDLGDLALALWAEARIDGSAVPEVQARIQRRMPAKVDRLPLEDVAFLACGASEAAAVEGGDRAGLVALAVEELRTRLGESGVFLDAHHRWGRSLGPVSAQFHALNGLRRAADGDDAEVVLAARGISGLQNAGGAWPGVIDTRKGRGAEPYPVFTVNQIALPAIALRGLDEAPLGPAFDWIEGRNPLGFSLIHPTEERIDHGVVPKRRIGSIARGVGRAGTRLRGEPRELGPDDLILDPLVTAEDLGWLLEAWAGRSV